MMVRPLAVFSGIIHLYQPAIIILFDHLLLLTTVLNRDE
jgi:hypothetical protein